MKYGADGYAIYWYCIELIAGNIDKNNITFELEHDAELIGNTMKVDTLRVEEIMKTMVEIGLFNINPENNRVMCLKLASRLDDTTSKNPEIRTILAKAKEYGTIKYSNQYVYVFQDNDKYKIGKTNNVERRFNDAKTLNTNVSLFYFIKTVDAYLMESKLHNYFNNKRIEGEWFLLSKEDLKFICTIKSIEDIPDMIGITPNGSEQIRLDKNRLDKNRKEEKKEKKKTVTFIKPTIEELSEYIQQQQCNFSAEQFYNYYETVGWMVGKNKMKNWKSAISTWKLRDKNKSEKIETTEQQLERMRKEGII